MKKTLAIMMTAVLSMSVLFGCSGKAATETKAAETTAATEAETTEGGTLKTGLSVIQVFPEKMLLKKKKVLHRQT